MDNTRKASPSEMGGSDILDFNKIERELVELLKDISLDDSDTSGTSETSVTSVQQVHAEVDDKVHYFNKKLSDLQKKRNDLVTSYLEIDSKIDFMMKTIMSTLQARHNDLRKDLNMMAMNSLKTWEQQIIVCQEALTVVSNSDFRTSRVSGVLDNHDLIKQIEFDHSVELKFRMKNYAEFIKSLQCLGSIDCISSTNLLRPKLIFGSSGSKPGQFCRPWGVATDNTGRILICDRTNHRVQIFSQTGEFLQQFGEYGDKNGEFNRPAGIDASKNCRIVVSDKDNHRIQIFTSCGKFIFKFGGYGTKPGKFNYPWDISINNKDEIAVSDSKNHRVQLFNKKGAFITLFDCKKLHIHHRRNSLKILDSPRGLSFRKDGTLLITDFNNHRVIFLQSNFRSYSYFGSQGTSPAEFFRPQGIACDENGNFAVADSKNYRVQVFDKERKLIKVFGCRGNQPGEFDCPQGIAISIYNHIMVVDLSNDRIQVF